MQDIESVWEMHAWADEVRCAGLHIGFVPTMGYLHEGHMALVSYATERSDRCVVSIFVNPMQFGPSEDLDRYPRDLERDRRMLEEAGVDALYLPKTTTMYPDGFQSEVRVAGVTSGLCGRSRHGHFNGVTTVVAKLFNVVKPHLAVFGEKDFQQLVTIRRMATDLDFDVEVVGLPIVREEDGLAMSSRNRYLSSEERQAALSLSKALAEAREMVAGGECRAPVVLEWVRAALETQPLVRVDYVELVDVETMQPVTEVADSALLALAAMVGETRLIDNTVLEEENRSANTLMS